jgi:hypothetical protein
MQYPARTMPVVIADIRNEGRMEAQRLARLWDFLLFSHSHDRLELSDLVGSRYPSQAASFKSVQNTALSFLSRDFRFL